MQRDVFLFFWALAVAAHADAECLIRSTPKYLGPTPARAPRAPSVCADELGLDVDLADAVALDPGEPGLARFADPAPFARAARRGCGARRLRSELSAPRRSGASSKRWFRSAEPAATER